MLPASNVSSRARRFRLPMTGDTPASPAWVLLGVGVGTDFCLDSICYRILWIRPRSSPPLLRAQQGDDNAPGLLRDYTPGFGTGKTPLPREPGLTQGQPTTVGVRPIERCGPHRPPVSVEAGAKEVCWLGTPAGVLHLNLQDPLFLPYGSHLTGHETPLKEGLRRRKRRRCRQDDRA